MKLDGKLYQVLETIYNFFLLNLLWLCMSLFIVTLFPATAAMFGVIRQWKHKNDSGVFRPFFQLFKENFKNSFIIELLMIPIVLLLFFDFTFTKQMGSPFNMILIPIFIFMTAALLFTFAFIFPVLVEFQAGWRIVIKNSFLFSISNISLTITSLVVITVVGVIVWVFPFATLFIFSIGAYLIYSFCYRAFQRIIHTKDKLKPEHSSS